MPEELPRFLSVRQAAEYLSLNEKKIYALAAEGRIPGTKVTGKWMFPRELLDRWLVESSHGGVLSDRLVIAGGDDPLLYRLVLQLASRTKARAMISYTPTGTRLGLELLQAHRADVCAVHWGPSAECHIRHPALLSQFSGQRRWILLRAFRREQGFLLGPNAADTAPDLEALLRRPLRWAMRQQGAGAQRFLQETLAQYGVNAESLPVGATALSEREAAGAIGLGLADVAPGTRAAARENGLAFISAGWECFDLALDRGIFFRTLLQDLIDCIKGPEGRRAAELLGGYDLEQAGQLVWGQD